ncbi:putative phytosulfokines 6 [Corylus avellana]|uniref:putative phytosulfokines 6 n=1 Tax=Corylus avellana TaxID=13451 RepID=UPI00286D4360|nr:putative phytosulfokines 6 [Corylus avellana]
MKPQKFHTAVIFLFFVFLLCSFLASARLLSPKQGITHAANSFTDHSEEFSNLMGLEECHGDDGECLKGRMMVEAHLDYIYTQHVKPKKAP